MLYRGVIEQALSKHNFRRFTPAAALIDMDGTLYDSMPNHARAWKILCNELGIDATESEFLMWEGRTGADTINELFRRQFGRDATAEEKECHYHRKTELFKAFPIPAPMPGAAEMLSILEQAGIQRVLVTGSGQDSLISRLDRDFPGAFRSDRLVTAHNVEHGKPHPEPFLKGMQLARVSPSAAIAIDNAPLGVKAGHRSGAFTVGVVTGDIPASALEEAGADIVFQSMPAFAEALPVLLLDMLTTHLD